MARRNRIIDLARTIRGRVGKILRPSVAGGLGLAIGLLGGTQALAKQGALASGAATSCSTIHGAERLFTPGLVLLLGGIHGTAESPAFAAALACRTMAAGRSVTVALELPDTLTPMVDDYLASDGTAHDRKSLVAKAAAANVQRDGRFSEAIMELIEELRRLRQRGGVVKVVLFVPSQAASDVRRERLMAERIARAVEESGSDLVIVLTGLLHSQVIRGTKWNPEHESLGFLLSQWLPPERLLSLAVSHAGGTAWICTSTHTVDCRPVALTGTGGGTENTVYWVGNVGETGHHGIYFVGELSYSPPVSVTAVEVPFSDPPVTELPLESPPRPGQGSSRRGWTTAQSPSWTLAARCAARP